MKTDDPKFTAYALGELDANERAEVEALLREEPALSAEVESTRALAAQLRRELHAEPDAPLTPAQRAEVLAAAPAPALAKVTTFPARRWLPLAASIALVAGVSALIVRQEFREKAALSALRIAVETPVAESDITIADAEAKQDAPAPNPEPHVLSLEVPLPQSRVAAQKEMPLSPAAPAEPAGNLTELTKAMKDGAEGTTWASQPGAIRVLPPLPPEAFKNPRPSATTSPESVGGKLDGLERGRRSMDWSGPVTPNKPTSPGQPATSSRGLVITGGTTAYDPESAPLPRPKLALGADTRAKTDGLASADGSKMTTPQIVEFEGFINYGSPIQTIPPNELKHHLDRVSAGTVVNQPKAKPAPADSRFENSAGTATVSKAGLGDLTALASAPTKHLYESVDELRLSPLPELRVPTTGNTEAYDAITDNPFLPVAANPLSTFSIDVDTASYANVRRFLNQGQRPPKGAVRIEELVNYFTYDYPQPAGDAPFSATMEVATCPWAPEHRLMRVGLKGRDIARSERPVANLVFLIDVSGSMQPENRLPLVKESLRLLIDQLGPEDQVAMAVYAGASGTVLPPTSDKAKMRRALDKLEAGGSTNGASGIQLAYELAEKSFIKGGTNRVILATDGDFNVGVTSQSDLVDLIEKKAKGGTFLTVLGYGMGNLKDSTLEKLADKGNGNYAYIDTLLEAKKVLVEQMNGTLFTIAKDVKIQVEFNPAQVSAYRLIGYENRMLAKEDFNDDKKDAGEIGAGHTVTALYEIVPAGAAAPGVAPKIDDLKYAPKPATTQLETLSRLVPDGTGPEAAAKEMLSLKLRYKKPDGDVSTKLEFPLTDTGATWEKSSRDFRWAAAVASFGMLMRESPHKGTASWNSTLELALEGKGEDRSGYRAEFLGLLEKARDVVR